MSKFKLDMLGVTGIIQRVSSLDDDSPYINLEIMPVDDKLKRQPSAESFSITLSLDNLHERAILNSKYAVEGGVVFLALGHVQFVTSKELALESGAFFHGGAEPIVDIYQVILDEVNDTHEILNESNELLVLDNKNAYLLKQDGSSLVANFVGLDYAEVVNLDESLDPMNVPLHLRLRPHGPRDQQRFLN